MPVICRIAVVFGMTDKIAPAFVFGMKDLQSASSWKLLNASIPVVCSRTTVDRFHLWQGSHMLNAAQGRSILIPMA
jgi:hypothetical protein